MSSPSVSVLVTAYNHERFVTECLDSVRAQTVQDFELIIVDNGSRDATADRIQTWLMETRFPANFIRHSEPLGLCATLNYELSLTRCPFMCWLSADDACEPERIERQLNAFQQQSGDVAAVYGDARMVDATGRQVQSSFLRYHLGDERLPAGAELLKRLLLRGNFIPSPTVMMRRQAVDLVGRFDETLYYEDYQMWLKLSHRFGFHYVDSCLARYRVLPNSMAHSPLSAREMLESDSRILTSWLGRVGEIERALVDRLWSLGSRQLDGAFYDDAKRSYATAAAAGVGRWRHIAVGLLGLPGIPVAASLVRRGYRFARRRRTGVARLAQRLGAQRRTIDGRPPSMS